MYICLQLNSSMVCFIWKTAYFKVETVMAVRDLGCVTQSYDRINFVENYVPIS